MSQITQINVNRNREGISKSILFPAEDRNFVILPVIPPDSKMLFLDIILILDNLYYMMLTLISRLRKFSVDFLKNMKTLCHQTQVL